MTIASGALSYSNLAALLSNPRPTLTDAHDTRYNRYLNISK